MRERRAFISGITVGLLARPHVAEARQARAYRVGVVLQGGQYFSAIDGRRDGLRELGLEEGKQFVLLVRDGKGDQGEATSKLTNRIWWLNPWLLVFTAAIFALTFALSWDVLKKLWGIA